MSFSVRKTNNCFIFDINSNGLDFIGLKSIRHELMKISLERPQKIIFNLSKLHYINNVFCQFIIAMSKKLNSKCKICIYGLRTDVLISFYLVKLDSYVSLYNTESDAANSNNELIKRKFHIV